MGISASYGNLLKYKDQIVAAVRSNLKHAEAFLGVLEKYAAEARVIPQLRAYIGSLRGASAPQQPKPATADIKALPVGLRTPEYPVLAFDQGLILTRADVARCLLALGDDLMLALADFFKIDRSPLQPVFTDDPVEALNNIFVQLDELATNERIVLLYNLLTRIAVYLTAQRRPRELVTALVEMRTNILEAELLAQPPAHYHGVPIDRTMVANIVDSFGAKDAFSKFVYVYRNGGNPYQGFALVSPHEQIPWNEFRQRLIEAFLARPALIPAFLIAAGEWQGIRGMAGKYYADFLMIAYTNAVPGQGSVGVADIDVATRKRTETLAMFGLVARDGGIFFSDRGTALRRWLTSSGVRTTDLHRVARSYTPRFDVVMRGEGSLLDIADDFVEAIYRQADVTGVLEILKNEVFTRTRNPELDLVLAAIHAKPTPPPAALRVSHYSVSSSDTLVRNFQDFESPLKTRLALLGPAVLSSRELAQVLRNIRLAIPAGLESMPATQAWRMVAGQLQMFQGGYGDRDRMITTFFNEVLKALPSEAARGKFLELLQEGL